MDPDRMVEARLRGQALRSPPASLDRWVGRRGLWPRRAAWAAAAVLLAAVGAAGLAFLAGRDRRPGADAPPVRVDRTWSRTLDGGTVLLDDEPHRLLQRETLRHISWRDPADDARYEVTVPQTEILLVAERPN
jgi:hypothetical protein